MYVIYMFTIELIFKAYLHTIKICQLFMRLHIFFQYFEEKYGLILFNYILLNNIRLLFNWK